MLLALHTHPELLEGMSPALRKRMTGASLFTMRPEDADLLPELELLVQRSFNAYMSETRGRS